MCTCFAVSRFLLPTINVPIVKLPFDVVTQPLGGLDGGAMPSGTAWAKLEAAKKSGPRKLEGRMVSS